MTTRRRPVLPSDSIAYLNTGMTQVRLPVIPERSRGAVRKGGPPRSPEQCRLHHDWGPGLVDMTAY